MTDVRVPRSLLKRALDVLERCTVSVSTDFGPTYEGTVNNKKGVERDLRTLLRPRCPTGAQPTEPQ